MQEIILASQSPRRKQLLEWAEIPFEIIVRPTAETFPDGISCVEAVAHIARQKAEKLAGEIGLSKPILAADTIVVLNERIIGKPASSKEAVETLASLSGNTHEVMTGVCILSQNETIEFVDRTTVVFHTLTESDIRFYVEKYKPFDKAGAYAIQEWIGVVGIKSVAGDFYNVMGLPVSRVVQALRQLNA